MSSSRKTAERFFGSSSRAFLPAGLVPASSRLLAMALVVGAAATVDLRSQAHAAPQAYGAAPPSAQLQDVQPLERGYERRPGLLGGIKGAIERKVDRVVDGVYERRERRLSEVPGYGAPGPAYGAEAYGYGAPAPAYGRGGSPIRREAAVILDRQSGDYVFGAGRGAIRVGKDVVENIAAAANTTGADPALVMALSWRSGAAAEMGALPNSGVRVAGMFAYSEQRFLEEMIRWGGALGVGDQVSSIRRTPQGALVAVGHAHDTFEGMRHDIHASAVVGAANAKSAQAHLDQAAPGRHGVADVLVAVQFGNDVAVNLITARMTNPHKPMTGPLADVVAGMGLPAVDESGRAWTISSFHEATEMRLRAEMRAFAPIRDMQLAEQHRPVAPQGASYPTGPGL